MLQAADWLVSFTAIFRLITQRFSTQTVLGDDPKNGCEGDCRLVDNQLSLNVLLLSCNPIGQLCLSDPSNSHTVRTQIQVDSEFPLFPRITLESILEILGCELFFV